MVKKILAQLEQLVFYWQKKHCQKKIASKFLTADFAFFHRHDQSQQILTLYQIRLAKTLNKRIVFVTGCFDLLHQEHRKFLQKAKKEGDVLVVGLESDERIRRLKGKNRPLNSFSVRRKNLLRLNEVDLILELPEDFDKQATRLALLRLIKPDILAISSCDPLEEQKRKECFPIGCQLKIVHQYNPKISTSKLL